jgi:hypothetical protein
LKKTLLLIFASILSLNLIGCLTIETKEYFFKIKGGSGGEGKIKYINIMRTDDSSSSIESDYNDLITSYLNGNKPEDELTGVKNVKKRLFEEDNVLCGEITFEFDDITSLKFYRYSDKIWCYYINSNSFGLFGGNEAYFSSNGTYGGENMPVIFWNADEKEFNFKTTVSQNDKKNMSLIEIWRKNGGK